MVGDNRRFNVALVTLLAEAGAGVGCRLPHQGKPTVLVPKSPKPQLSHSPSERHKVAGCSITASSLQCVAASTRPVCAACDQGATGELPGGDNLTGAALEALLVGSKMSSFLEIWSLI